MNDQNPVIDAAILAAKSQNLLQFEETFLVNMTQQMAAMNYQEAAQQVLFLRRMYMTLFSLSSSEDDPKAQKAMADIDKAFRQSEQDAEQLQKQLEERYDTAEFTATLRQLHGFRYPETSQEQVNMFWDQLGRTYFNTYLSVHPSFLRFIYNHGLKYGKSLCINTNS